MRRIAARRAQQPVAQVVDEAAFLGHRHEYVGRDRAEHAIGPPCQCLETEDAAVVETDERLVVDRDGVGRPGAQLAFDPGATDHVGVHLGLEASDR
jgi:hypothetical protein